MPENPAAAFSSLKAPVYTAAIVGTGRIGFSLGFDKKREQPASHTMALLAQKRIRLVAGCDRDTERLGCWQRYVQKKQRSALPVFSDSGSMYVAFAAAPASRSSIDIIVVAVNEDAHLAECIAAIRARPRLVILEKPVALNSREAAQIAACAEECGVPVLVNHERRFAADYAAARAYMDKIGEIQSIRADLFSGLRVYSAGEEKTGAYSLLHDGTHLVDILQFLLEAAPGAGQERMASATASADDLPRTTQEHVLLKNPLLTGVFRDDKADVRNFSAHFQTSFCPDITLTMSGRSRFFAFSVDILGTQGRIVIGNGFAKFYQRKESHLYTGFYSLRRDKSIRLPKKTGYFANMVQNGVDFLDGKAPLKSPLAVAMADLAVLEEIKASLQK